MNATPNTINGVEAEPELGSVAGFTAAGIVLVTTGRTPTWLVVVTTAGAAVVVVACGVVVPGSVLGVVMTVSVAAGSVAAGSVTSGSVTGVTDEDVVRSEPAITRKAPTAMRARPECHVRNRRPP